MQELELFELLVREHATSLRVFLRSATRNDAVADDLFQETLIQAWRHRDRFDRDRSFGKWLRGIARNLLREHRRQLSKRPRQLEDDVLELLDARCAAWQTASHDTLEDDLALLRSCIEELPDHYREAITVRYRKEVRGEALARALSISFDNVKKRLQRARGLLQGCVETKMSLRGGLG